MIRDCTERDIDSLISMSGEFWQVTDYKDEKFDPEAVRIMIERTISDGLCLVYEFNGSVEGFVCGVKGPLLANFDIMTGTELAWWVNKDHRSSGAGIQLMKAIEEKAKSVGVKYWNMAYMTSSMPKEIKSIYQSMGYKLSECLYQKVL